MPLNLKDPKSSSKLYSLGYTKYLKRTAITKDYSITIPTKYYYT